MDHYKPSCLGQMFPTYGVRSVQGCDRPCCAQKKQWGPGLIAAQFGSDTDGEL